MDKAIEVDVGFSTHNESVHKLGRKKVASTTTKKKVHGRSKKGALVCLDGQSSPDHIEESGVPGLTLSLFDYSIENYFREMDMALKICGEPVTANFEESEVDRLLSTVTFLNEWRHFNYRPRLIRFASETGTPQEKVVLEEINLPQFSAAMLPKTKKLSTEAPLESRKDFVLYVGGSVWALDWCPTPDLTADCQMNCQFIAVSAHPPDSTCHKLGAPLSGRGMVQIWCLVNGNVDKDVTSCLQRKPNQKFQKYVAKEEKTQLKTPRGRPKKKEETQPKRPRGRPKRNEETQPKRPRGRPKKNEETQPKRPRGRPRKNPTNMVPDNYENLFIPALSIRFPKKYSDDLPTDGNFVNSPVPMKGTTKKRKAVDKGVPSSDPQSATNVSKGKWIDKEGVENGGDNDNLQSLTEYDDVEPSYESLEGNSLAQNDVMSSGNDAGDFCSEFGSSGHSIRKDLVLPRVVLCIGHDGKVAWDVKWKPSNPSDSDFKHRIGYLAVVLGNGSIEVWEVPSSRMVRVIYYSRRDEDIDPRFVKLKPVFRGSMLKCGDRHSMPLTVEWSTSSPHDLILAGCHDGVVALWKFSASDSSKETRPLLCFSADAVPIRALAWAPCEGDPESSNVVVTAGHEGMKFWDLRDPFRPLWSINPAQKFIYSLDWLPDPRCMITSYDDGTLRILSLSKAAYDVPVTGKPFAGTQQQGLYSYYCSPFAIWSVQVSRLTGMVAYCGADGNALYFQLTAKVVEKDPFRNRAPHFLCGSVVDEGSAVTVSTPLPNTPYPMKKSANEWGNTPRSMRGFIYSSNQAKRRKEETSKNQNPNDQVLALSSSDGGNDDANEPLKITKRRKMSSAKKPNEVEPPSISRDGYSKNVEMSADPMLKMGIEIEALPSKLIAMHRVRWNMNKGSERWLCYGGAAGIVRCQEIFSSEVDEKPWRKLKHQAQLL
ncbi:hypothetical protein Nepgr_028186 [Nepenthes gracilis]|uniref:Uncharacterized protein n=1 Tax=Nepenthes gracilis TaxID=150966 RepID=A0AAD3TA63_NEPGR|nr:hypothetical protein Nepgr_028186 [Nepenthes gracilis]